MLYRDIPTQARAAFEAVCRACGSDEECRLRVSRGDGLVLLTWPEGPSYLQLLGQFFNNGRVEDLPGNYFTNRGGGLARALRFESPPNMAPFWLTPEESQQMELLHNQRQMVERDFLYPLEDQMQALRLAWEERLPAQVQVPQMPDVRVPRDPMAIVREAAGRVQLMAADAQNRPLRWAQAGQLEGPEVVWADDPEDEEEDD